MSWMNMAEAKGTHMSNNGQILRSNFIPSLWAKLSYSICLKRGVKNSRTCMDIICECPQLQWILPLAHPCRKLAVWGAPKCKTSAVAPRFMVFGLREGRERTRGHFLMQAGKALENRHLPTMQQLKRRECQIRRRRVEKDSSWLTSPLWTPNMIY